MSHILIIYYSWSGNTRKIAHIIQKEVGGDMVEIIPENPYPSSYNATVEQAKKEIKMDYKPPIKTKIEDIEKYDIIFVGTPNWWSTIAPPVATFLTQHNLLGKTIIPFITHGGGGQGRVVSDIKRLCPESKVLEPLSIYEGGSTDLREKILEWLKKLPIKRGENNEDKRSM
ncbi:flavodoxin [Dictyoglomus thermophilum]|uniref:Flavodoxin n=1 Tax=Dictyoglomus thermophilum (strain ATCC 35947 / DSM 3960 / H-6-12) TaxID=309799 RepID=B5YAS5_DICT6|nr:flavodoxin [Dictyoglomus thermophilum]ACI19752.1 flavodoxin [Dictyoglomus thermophilum H-6-12]